MILKSLFLFFISCVLILGLTANSNITQASVTTNDLHLPLTPKYSSDRTKKVTHVLVHFISNAGKNPNEPYNVNSIYNIFLDYGFSTHYMIGRSGEIYKLVDEERVAFHAGKGSLSRFSGYKNNLNDYSIGIELLAIGTRNEMMSMISSQAYDSVSSSDIGYTDAQYRSLNRLLDGILNRHPLVKRNKNHILGHEEYAPGRKPDPGKLFAWARVDFTQKHYVREGDTLWEIAQKYGVTIDSIALLNTIDPNKYLQIGQKLIIPATYKVLSGDTLWEIAKKYGVSIETLTNLNNLNPKDFLQVGQRLKIPSGTTTYRVKSGDTLWRIAQKYHVSIDTIVKVNHLDPNAYLQIGQNLLIPQ
ncbi:LysM peptidoglycan-binding domain-containing protein [Filobacillus milosensis]|nr:LysM peptidoglycan-binding domain-containing protein [Filobacillus milosensis]